MPLSIDLYFTFPQKSSTWRGANVVLIDVLRSTTSICHGMAAGCSRILPAADLGEVTELVESLGRSRVLLGGEKDARRIPGFDLGNSPAEYADPRLKGQTVVMLTGNGTVALARLRHQRVVAIAALVNLGATARWLARQEGDVVIICSGNREQFCLEDALCGGLLVRRLLDAWPEREPLLNDAARVGLALAERYGADPRAGLEESTHGRGLQSLGFGADLERCARVDELDLVPFYHDEQITLRPPAPEVEEDETAAVGEIQGSSGAEQRENQETA
ncbi:MAG: 2-phosphosulfolactate phosphatase [Candidatus Delongbacteria bacterium]